MKGRNELNLCPHEMMRAIEFYLNEVQFKEQVKVVKIEQKNDSYFQVSLVEAKEEGDGENGMDLVLK